jgi:lysophospholipase L1-like esterase
VSPCKVLVMQSLRIVDGLVAVCFLLCAGNLQAQQVAPYLRNTNYGIQLGMYDLFASTQADVVMLGNSLTFNANWNEILNRSNIANRGIASDITSGYLHRLGYVTRLNPKLCFIEGGVNDLYSNDSVKNIVRNYADIIDSLQSHHIVPVIQSTLFVGAKYPHAREKNKQIQTLNTWLIAYALKNGIEFLDINHLVSKDGFLRSDLTYDGIHLNARGYALWAPEVGKVLAKHNL